jgi:hypothetical protein
VTRPRSRLAGLLFDAWRDLDRVLDGVDEKEALERLDGGSSFAWTLAHTTNQVDAWINVRFQKTAPHEYIGLQRFRIGGPGVTDDWDAVRRGVVEVRAAARRYLTGLSDDDLAVVIAYDGSFLHLRDTGISLRYALFRSITHHYFHIGEISTKRDRLGHEVGDYPGTLEESL